MADVCSPCARPFISIASALHMIDDGNSDYAIDQLYGCGKRQSDGQWCLPAGINSSVAIQEACGSESVLEFGNAENICSVRCSETIAAQLAIAECCSDMAVASLLVEVNTHVGTSGQIQDYKARIADSCPNVT